MQTVKKNLVKGIEEEGEFLCSEITGEHLEQLRKLLSKPKVTYGAIKTALKKYKIEILGNRRV